MLPPGSEPSGSAGQMNQVTGLTKAVRIMAPMMSTPAVSTKRVDTAITPKLACSCVCAAGVKSGRGEEGGGGGIIDSVGTSVGNKPQQASSADYDIQASSRFPRTSPYHAAVCMWITSTEATHV